jgi:aspartate/methionine/tyrosine aminotransferase
VGNMSEIQSCVSQNVKRFKAAYDLCAASILDSSLTLTKVDAGFHAIAFLEKTGGDSSQKKAREVAARIIVEHGISLIPLAHFGFPPFAPIGYRINLSKHPSKLEKGLSILVKLANEYPDLANQLQ